MKSLVIFLILAFSICAQDSLVQLYSIDTNLIGQDTIASKKSLTEKDSSSIIESDLTDIIPDSQVRNTLSDIFSLSKVIWAIIFL